MLAARGQIKLTVAALAAVVLIGLTPGAGRAQSILLQGWTNGCFGTGCVPVNSNTFQTAQYQTSLRYLNSEILTTVQNGGTAILDEPGRISQRNFNNFGSFVGLGGGINTLNNVEFNLRLTLVSPTNTSIVFEGLVNGTIVNGSLANVSLAFSNSPATITFTQGNGFAIINIQGLGSPAGDAYNISGRISTHVTPEPATMFLLGTGLVGLGGALRRRRKGSSQATP